MHGWMGTNNHAHKRAHAPATGRERMHARLGLWQSLRLSAPLNMLLMSFTFAVFQLSRYWLNAKVQSMYLRAWLRWRRAAVEISPLAAVGASLRHEHTAR